MSAITQLPTVGLALNFSGALCLIKSALFVTEKKAIEVTAARLGPANREFPAVRERLDQRNWTIVGAALLALGFILQLL